MNFMGYSCGRILRWSYFGEGEKKRIYIPSNKFAPIKEGHNRFAFTRTLPEGICRFFDHKLGALEASACSSEQKRKGDIFSVRKSRPHWLERRKEKRTAAFLRGGRD